MQGMSGCLRSRRKASLAGENWPGLILYFEPVSKVVSRSSHLSCWETSTILNALMLKVVSETSQSSKLFTVSRIFFLSLGVLPALCLFPRVVDLLLAEAEVDLADEGRCRVPLLFFFFSLDFLFSFFSFFFFLLLSSADNDEDSLEDDGDLPLHLDLDNITHITHITHITNITQITQITQITNITQITYITHITNITYITQITYITYITYITQITYITFITQITQITQIT